MTTYEQAFAAAERELGEAIGYPALVYGKEIPPLPNVYLETADLYDEEPVYCAIHKMQNRSHPYWQEHGVHCSVCAELANLRAQVRDAQGSIAALRAQLDDAHQHIGALTSGGKVAHAAAWMLRQLVRNELIKGEYTLDEARILTECYEQTAFGTTIADALDWLRREAK